MITMACVNIEGQYRFNRTLDRARAISFLKNCRYSPTVRVVGYKDDNPVWDNELSYYYGEQVKDIMALMPYIMTYPLYTGGKKIV